MLNNNYSVTQKSPDYFFFFQHTKKQNTPTHQGFTDQKQSTEDILYTVHLESIGKGKLMFLFS